MQTIDIEKLATYVEDKIGHHDSAHSWWHIQDVVKRALYIAKHEKADINIVHAGALLHESYDSKLVKKGSTKTHEDITNEIKKILSSIGFNENDIAKIVFIIKNVGFKGGQRVTNSTLEFQCVQDADFLTSLGAIAIGRTFSYGGKHDRPLYLEGEKPRTFANREEYYATALKSQASSFGHIQDKLLKLYPEGFIVTKTGRRLAKPLHEFTQLFFDQFLSEATHQDLI